VKQFASFANFAYAAQSAEQKMDVYLHPDKSEVNILLFIHGGGWVSGDKTDYIRPCIRGRAKGICCVTMNYRMLNPGTPERQSVNYLSMLDDIGMAIVALKTKLIAEGYPPRKLALCGASAGAHLAMLYGYSRYEQSAIPITFLAQQQGPTDFTDSSDTNQHKQKSILWMLSMLANKTISGQDVLNKVPALKDMSPLYHVKPGAPPTLMCYGGKDELVPLSQGINLRTALDLAGVRNDIFVYPNSGHGWPDTADSAIQDAYNAKFLEYFNTYFRE